MKKGFVKSLIVLVTLICGLIFLCVACKKNQSDEADANVAGTILVTCEGDAYLEDASGNRKQIAAGDVIGNGDILVTEEGGKAVVSLNQKGKVYLEENTRLKFVLEENSIDLFVSEGKILVDAKEKLDGIERLTVHTAAMTVDVQETVLLIENQQQKNGSSNSVVGVLKGTAEVSYTGLDNPPTKISEGQKADVLYQNEEKEIKIKNVTDSKISQEDLADLEETIQTAGLSDQVQSLLENNEDKKTDDSKKKDEEKEKNNKNDRESAKVDNNYVIPDYSQPLPVPQYSEPLPEPQNDPSENTPAAPKETEKPITTAVTFASESATKDYDGTALSDNTITVTGMPEGYTYSAACAASITDAGSTENIISEIKIFDANGKDVTKLFTNITRTNGVLTITPAAVTVTTGSAWKVYDGEALSCEDVTITGLVNGETASVTATGSITDAGTAVNTYSIDWGTTNPDNYTVTESIGTLSVEALQLNVQWKPDNELQYDGSSHTAAEGSVDIISLDVDLNYEMITTGEEQESGKCTYLFDLYTGEQITVTASGKGCDAGTYDVTIQAEVTQGKAANFSITCSESSFTILKATLTIKTGSAEKLCDGKDLSCSDAEVKGLKNGETITVTPNATISEEGETPNTYQISWGDTNPDNYTVEEELGTLKVYCIHIITVTELSLDEDIFQAKYTVSNLPEGWYVENVTFSADQNRVESYILRNNAGEDVTSLYPAVCNERGYEVIGEGHGNMTRGVYVDMDRARVIFVNLLQIYTLKCTDREANNLVNAFNKSNPDMSDKEFEQYVRDQLKAKGWI